MPLYLKIAFQQKTGASSNILTYSLPQELESKIKLGQSVAVLLRNKKLNGIVWEINNEKPEFRTRDIEQINDSKPLLSESQIKLINWMGEYYFCSLDKVLKLFIPKRIFNQKPFRKTKEKDEQIIDSGLKELTGEQRETVDEIIKSKENSFLIQGITGSGKTEVYCHIADHYIKQEKQVLILIPEISLTPQTIEYFETTLGTKATVINSKQSEGERYKAWENIWKNKAKLTIGSRSAIFAGFQDLGAIIVDEEHENSYKQDNSPRYSIHKILEQINTLSPKIKTILASATPKTETAEKLKNRTLKLKKRIGTSQLPDIEIVDLKTEFKKGNKSIFSENLQKELIKTLEKKEQAILFINRRGSASSVVCRDCGYKSECIECELPFTYHKKTLAIAALICHHCGKIEKPPTSCPECKGSNIRFLGIGTQRIEQELAKAFPQARTLRADKDTTANKHDFENIYKAFKNHEADILIGTQMIAKGLHLPKVNLVGVILADIGLNIPNFRAAERNFQLMTQVAGRAGRTEKKGKVIIQTYNPDNISLQLTKEHNYEKFLEYEIQQRKLLHNPPFGQLANITIADTSEHKVIQLCQEIERELWKTAREENITEEIEILSYPSYFLRVKGKYRYSILIKDKALKKHIHKLLAKIPKEYTINPDIKIDIDPINL